MFWKDLFNWEQVKMWRKSFFFSMLLIISCIHLSTSRVVVLKVVTCSSLMKSNSSIKLLLYAETVMSQVPTYLVPSLNVMFPWKRVLSRDVFCGYDKGNTYNVQGKQKGYLRGHNIPYKHWFLKDSIEWHQLFWQDNCLFAHTTKSSH